MSDATEIVKIKDDLPRDTTAVPCVCGGFADSVDCTDEEDRKYGCGRRRCCSAAFVCRLCGKRLVGTFESPEME